MAERTSDNAAAHEPPANEPPANEPIAHEPTTSELTREHARVPATDGVVPTNETTKAPVAEQRIAETPAPKARR